jgi:hypothetical protein
MQLTGPCYDLLVPPETYLNEALPEHLYWDAVPPEGLQRLTGTDGPVLQKAQSCAAQQAITSLQTQLVVVESSVGFSRYRLLRASTNFLLSLLLHQVHGSQVFTCTVHMQNWCVCCCFWQQFGRNWWRTTHDCSYHTPDNADIR